MLTNSPRRSVLMLMEYLKQKIKSYQWAFDLILRPYRLVQGLTTTPLEIQLAESSLDMARKHPNEHTDDSGHGSKKVRGPNNKRREGPATRGRNQEDGSVSRSERIEQSRELEDSFRKLSDAHKAAVSELRETQNNYKNQQQEINSLNNKLRDISTLLDVRNRELKVAKTFLSMEDLFSTSDVVQTVRDLNSEVMQTAALLTDNLTLKRVRDHQIGAIPEGPYKPVFVVLAFPQVSGDEVDAALLELALQSYFIVWVYWMANAWGFYEASGWCDELYSKVREKGS